VVRTAAVRVLGLSKNKEAVDKLMEMVAADKFSRSPPGRYGLGQIGTTGQWARC